MKKYAVIAALSIGLLMSGCENTIESEPQNGNTQLESEMLENSQLENLTKVTEANASDSNIPEQTNASAEPVKSTEIVQNGPYGRLSITLPAGWDYETFSTDSDLSILGMYGIHFYPEGVSEGYIELSYIERFGVCGTGLSEEETTIAGVPANIGTYDNNAYWDFISFREPYNGVVALTYSADDWWDTYGNSVLNILNTTSFDPDVREGSAYIYKPESEIDQIGLSFSLKNISPTGATMVFQQYDADAPTGDLLYSDDFAIEVQKDGVWETAPIVVVGDYGFTAIAFTLTAGETSERELRWAWLYGELEPGNYRLTKSVLDFRDSGDFDEYTVYAYFVLN